MSVDQIQLSTNAIKEYLDGKTQNKAILQIANLKLINNVQDDGNESLCYRVTISDGITTYASCILNSSLNKLVTSDDLKENTIIRIKEITVDVLDDETNRIMLIINDIDILQTNAKKINYLSKDAEEKQPLNNLTALQTIKTFPITTNISISVGRSSLMSIQRNVSNNQAASDAIDNDTLIPISQINQYSNKWYIKGVVTNKSNIHHYNNSHGVGSVFSFDFLDSSDEIRVTVFNNDCNRLYSSIHVGNAYQIAKAAVKSVNRQYNKLSSNYEILVTPETIINSCSTDTHLQASTSRYNFVPLCDVQNQRTNSVFDVIGIIDNVLDPTIVTNNMDHKSYVKRTIHIVDETGSVAVTLWQDQATNFDGQNHSVLALEGIKVHDYNGRRSLTTTPTTYLKYNPIDTERTEKLKQWFEHYSQTLTKPTDSNIFETYSYKTLTEAILEYATDHNKSIYFFVKAACKYIDKNNLIYKMCPIDGCAKKVVENSEKQFYCTKCHATHHNFKWGYMTTIQISDSSITQSIMVFNKQAEILIRAPASEIANYIINNNNDMVDTILSNILNHEYRFKLSVQNDRYKNQLCMICIDIDKITDVPSTNTQSNH